MYFRLTPYHEMSSCRKEQDEGLKEENLQKSDASRHFEQVKCAERARKIVGQLTYPPLERYSVAAVTASALVDIFDCSIRLTVNVQGDGHRLVNGAPNVQG